MVWPVATRGNDGYQKLGRSGRKQSRTVDDHVSLGFGLQPCANGMYAAVGVGLIVVLLALWTLATDKDFSLPKSMLP